MKLSIIIPVFNESQIIVSALEKLQAIRNDVEEIILVDGGSQDDTHRLAKPYVDTVLISVKGRAAQMNYGAAHAVGDVLMFLHIDTHINHKHIQLIQQQIDTASSWGRFNVRFDDSLWIFSIIAFCMNFRSRISSIATGDQMICVHSELFKAVGGYPDIALMEDIALCKKLKIISKPVCFQYPVLTSARRWRLHGILKTILMMWCLRFGYFIGVPTERLGRLYE